VITAIEHFGLEYRAREDVMDNTGSFDPVPTINQFGTPYYMLLNLTAEEITRLRELVRASNLRDGTGLALLQHLGTPSPQEIDEFRACAIEPDEDE
jgi:hypothetical protein